MRERPRKAEGLQFLSGWKEIANYLGKGVRTVQRYERQLGLPVRRPAGKPWGSVVATRDEIDAWVKASPIRDEFLLSCGTPQDEHAKLSRIIQDRLDEMAMLRDQMAALRSEVRESVRVLRNNVQLLQGELHQNRWARQVVGNVIPPPVRLEGLAHLDEFDLLPLPWKSSKLS